MEKVNDTQANLKNEDDLIIERAQARAGDLIYAEKCGLDSSKKNADRDYGRAAARLARRLEGIEDPLVVTILAQIAKEFLPPAALFLNMPSKNATRVWRCRYCQHLMSTDFECEEHTDSAAIRRAERHAKTTSENYKRLRKLMNLARLPIVGESGKLINISARHGLIPETVRPSPAKDIGKVWDICLLTNSWIIENCGVNPCTCSPRDWVTRLLTTGSPTDVVQEMVEKIEQQPALALPLIAWAEAWFLIPRRASKRRPDSEIRAALTAKRKMSVRALAARADIPAATLAQRSKRLPS